VFPKVREYTVRSIDGQTASSDRVSASGRILVRGEGGVGARLPGTHMRREGKLGPLMPAVQQGGHMAMFDIER